MYWIVPWDEDFFLLPHYMCSYTDVPRICPCAERVEDGKANPDYIISASATPLCGRVFAAGPCPPRGSGSWHLEVCMPDTCDRIVIPVVQQYTQNTGHVQ